VPDWTADPFVHDAVCIVGDTLLLQFALEDSDGVAHNLSGVTGTASIRTEPGGLSVASPTVTVTSAADGEWEVELAAASTASLSPGSYRWAARLTWGDGTVKTVVEGRLTVRKVAI
jgi:hypothetical protein